MCNALNDHEWLIALPFDYSDGDQPEIKITAREGGFVTLSDFGSALNRLALNDVPSHTDRLQRSVRDVLRGYEVHLDKDQQLTVDVPADDVGEALAELTSIMLQLDALQALRQVPSEPRFASKLTTWLAHELPGVMEPNATVLGVTGKRYIVTARTIPLPAGQFLVQAVTKGATSNKSRIIDHTFRIFADVRQTAPRQKLSVLADHPDDYDQADLALLETVSTLATWHDRHRIVSHIQSPSNETTRRLFDDEHPELTLD